MISTSELMFAFDLVSVFRTPRSDDVYLSLISKVEEYYGKLEEIMHILEEYPVQGMSEVIALFHSNMVKLTSTVKDEAVMHRTNQFSQRYQLQTNIE